MSLSVSDQTSTSFDPFNQTEGKTNTFNIKAPTAFSLSAMLPILVVLVALFLVWKFLK